MTSEREYWVIRKSLHKVSEGPGVKASLCLEEDDIIRDYTEDEAREDYEHIQLIET